MTMFKKLALGAALCGLSATALATPILGDRVIVAADGNVTAKFLGSSAGYTNDLHLDAPVNGLGVIFTNHTTPVGTTRDLGYFTAGTELIFRIYVRNTGESFFTGDAIRNPDNIFHAVVDDAYSATETYVGFEDLRGGGDRDYDDVMFSFTNVKSSVPEPAVALLLGAGLVGLGLSKRASARKS